MGVPQGSVLGPLIFLLFVNDVPDYIKADSITLFAIDTSMGVSGRTKKELEMKCNRLIQQFSD